MLTLSKRDTSSKSELTRIRRADDIPAVMYSSHQDSTTVTVSGAEYGAILRKVKEGYLPVTIFKLQFEGKEYKALIKGVDYHKTTYDVVHIDFQILEDKTLVAVKIPVDFIGEADCEGIKLGGFLRKVMRHVKVRCLPKDIPQGGFPIDIKPLNIGQAAKVSDIKVSSSVKILANQEDVLCVIAKR